MIPLYKKISNDLKEQILSQKIKVGEKLPTEVELSEHYQVSRITAKHALKELEQEGLISRARGRGSIVESISSEKNKPSKKSILFIHPFSDLAFGDFTQGILPCMKEHDYNVFITHAEYLKESTIHNIIENFAALIYYPESTDDYLDVLSELLTAGFPVVLLDKEIHGLPFPCVRSDNFSGAFLATQHLIDLGHTRIAFMMYSMPHPAHTTRDRYLGYMSALNKAQLSFHTTYNKPEESSCVEMDYFKENEITAIVCENDVIALNLMTNLQNADFKVPEEISIVGFDNIQATYLSNPPLTTIEQNFQEMGDEAAKLVLKWLKDGEIPQNSKIDVHLIERNSTTIPQR